MKKRYILLFCTYFVLFSMLLYLFHDLLRTSTSQNYRQLEENYIEEVESDIDYDSTYTKAYKDTLFNYYKDRFFLSKKNSLRVLYIPSNYQSELSTVFMQALSEFLNHEKILRSISWLHVLLYEKHGNSRWTMKWKTIRLHEFDRLPDDEALAVVIHEFAHYYDIHSLVHDFWHDISDIFYDISWKDATQMKPGQKRLDFVSGYAMTNRYEDFAESYTFYVLHNDYFLLKAQDSRVLLQKYNFFSEYVFEDEFLRDTQKLSTEKLLEYYWDTTKVPFDIKKFLHYLQADV